GSIKLNNEIIRNYPCEHLFNIVTYPTIEAVPAIGYKFVNWSDGVTDSKRTITENMTVSANFEEIKEHKVQFSTSEGGQLYVTAKNWTKFAHSKYSIDDNLAEGSKVSLDVKPSKGYKFVKWIGNVHVDENKKDGYSFIVGDSDIRLTAIFDRIKHNVSISADNSGQFALTIDGKTEEMSSFNEEIPEDTLISIKLITPRWYAFKRWKGDGISLLSGNEDDGYSLVVGEEDINLTAHFEKISDGILTIPKMAGGTIKVNDEEVNTPYKHKFNYEEKVTIEAIPDEEEGYYFKGWNDLWNADSETIPTKRTIEITRDKTVFACFTNGILCKRAIWNANIKDAIQVPTKFFMSSGYTDPINENAKSNYIVCKMAARYSAHLLNDKNMYIDPLTGKTYDVLMVSSHGSGVDISPQQYKDPSAAVLNFTTCQELIDRIFDGLEGRDVESAYFNEENRQERPGFVWAKNRNGNWQPFVVKEIESGAFDYYYSKWLNNCIDCDVIIPWTVDCVGNNAFQHPNLIESKKLHVIYANRTCVDKNNVSYWEGVRNDEMDWSNSESWDEKVEILYDATRDRWTFPTVISKHGEKELTKFIPIQK
ncbi:MAG: InlB B-repeat-containing protein, partial [Malacoplasma sp.]|nr:InlB B-repeat-containing protein [Malacoplasma sp.]